MFGPDGPNSDTSIQSIFVPVVVLEHRRPHAVAAIYVAIIPSEPMMIYTIAFVLPANINYVSGADI